MGINPILNSVSASLAQQSSAVSLRSQPSVADVSQNSASKTQSASYTSPSQSVIDTANLVNASSNFAQLGSLLEVAQNGTEQVGTILQQLQSVAQQATGDIPSGDLTGLESEFQQLLSQVDQTANNTTFGGTSLLNGSLSGSAGADAATTEGASALSLPNLTAQGLFGNTSLDISTPQNAQSSLQSILSAQGTVDNTTSQITALVGQLSFAAASIDTVISNNNAAASTLNEGDLANGSAPTDSLDFLGNSAGAAQAQTGNLPPNLLSLLLD